MLTPKDKDWQFTLEDRIKELSTEQRVVFAILCAKTVCADRKWNAWANKRLAGRSKRANTNQIEYSLSCRQVKGWWQASDATWTAEMLWKPVPHAGGADSCTRSAALNTARSITLLNKNIDFTPLLEKAKEK